MRPAPSQGLDSPVDSTEASLSARMGEASGSRSEPVLADPDSAWGRLFDTAVKNDLALFLGAGTSIANKMPDWGRFAQRLAGLPDTTASGGKLAGTSFEALFGIAKRASGSAWHERVRQELYTGLLEQVSESAARIPGLTLQDFGRGAADGRGRARARARAREFFEETNPVLTELVRMCGNRGKGNSRVGAVLTTNVDGLIQLCDRAVHGSRTLRTIERSSARAEYGKVSLYHLHGYLLPPSARQTSSEAADRLVLTEEDYLVRNDDPNGWASGVLHFVLREFPTIFIGCSMADQLIRRALYRTQREREADLKAKYGEEVVPEKKLRRHFAVLRLDEKYPARNELRSAEFSQLGVWPLWVRNYHDELGGRLGRLRGLLR